MQTPEKKEISRIDEIISQHKSFSWEATKKENKIAFVGDMRVIIEAYDNEEIGISKICEIINCAYLANRIEYSKKTNAENTVAFSIWKEKNVTTLLSGGYNFEGLIIKTIPDLYDYWIENVKNSEL